MGSNQDKPILKKKEGASTNTEDGHEDEGDAAPGEKKTRERAAKRASTGNQTSSGIGSRKGCGTTRSRSRPTIS